MATAAKPGSVQAGGRLKFVDGLRGVAALLVVLYHQAPSTALTSRGYLGVYIFFVLSGFVIASVIGDHRITAGYFGRFILRRCVRLDIPYWVSICVAILLGVIVAYFGVPARHYSLAQISAHLVYMQGILGFKQINDVYWTLCLEIQFYLSLLLLVWIVQALGASARRGVFQWFIVATVAFSVLFNAEFLHPPRGFMIESWWAFGLGALTWWAISGRSARWPLLGALCLVMILPLAPHEEARLTSTAAAVALLLTASFGRMDVWLAGPVVQFLGRISYSLYLFHPLVGSEVEAYAARHMGRWEAFAIGFTASVVSAWIAYSLIERPAIALSRNVRLVPAAAGICAPVAEAASLPIAAPVREKSVVV